MSWPREREPWLFANEPGISFFRRACRFFGRSCELQGQYAQSVTWLERGLAASESLDSTEEAEISLITGLVHLRQGTYDKT